MVAATKIDWKEDRTMARKYMKPKIKYGAPGGIRTPNPQIRSLVLCPIELRARDEAEFSPNAPKA